MRDTAATRLASHILGEPLDQWLTARRDAGATWQQLADQLAEATRGSVSVSHETVRQWLMADETRPTPCRDCGDTDCAGDCGGTDAPPARTDHATR